MRPCRQGSTRAKIGFLAALPWEAPPPNPGFSDSVPQKVFCCCSQDFSDCCCYLPPLQAALFRSRLRRAPDQASTRRQRRRAPTVAHSWEYGRAAACSHAKARSVHLHLAASCSTSAPHCCPLSGGTHATTRARTRHSRQSSVTDQSPGSKVMDAPGTPPFMMT